MPTIAKLNAQLTASAAGFSAAFAQAGKVTSSFGGIFNSTASKVTAAAGALGVSLTAAAAEQFIRGQMEAIDVTAKLADSLGITTESLGGLQYLATYSGTSIDTLQAALARMSKTLGEVGSDDAAKAASALQRIGLDSKQLATLAPDVALGKIADALNGTANANDRNAAASALFSKSFASLLPLLREGSAGMEKAQAEAIKLGFAFSRVDAAKVEQANDAIQKISNIVSGVGNTIAIELSPYITAAAEDLSSMAMAGGSIGPTVTNAVEMVATSIAYAANTVDVLKAGWYALEGAIQSILAGVIGDLGATGKAIVSVANLLPGVEIEFDGFADTVKLFSDASEDSFKSAGEAFDRAYAGENVQKVTDFFQKVRDGADASASGVDAAARAARDLAKAADDEAAKVAETIDKIQKQIDEFGKTDSQKIALRLTADGATPEQVAQAVAAQDKLTALEEQSKATDAATASAKKYIEATQGPAEKYLETLAEITRLQALGLLSGSQAAIAYAKAAEELAKSGDTAKATDPGGPKLLQSGTQEAASFVASIQRAQNRDGITEQKAIAKNTTKANTHLAKIAANTDGGSGGTTWVEVNF